MVVLQIEIFLLLLTPKKTKEPNLQYQRHIGCEWKTI